MWFYVLLFGQKCHINLMHSMHVALDIVRNLLGAQLSFITSLMDVNSVTQYTPQPEEVNIFSSVFLRNVKKVTFNTYKACISFAVHSKLASKEKGNIIRNSEPGCI